MNNVLLFFLVIGFLTSFSSHASYIVPMRNVLVSVGDLKNNHDKTWKREICLQVYTIAAQITSERTNITCREFSTDSFVDRGLPNLMKNHEYHIRIMKNHDDSINLDLTNWKRIHQSDFSTLAWKFFDNQDAKITKEDAFHKTIGNIFLYADNEEAYKAGLLANGVFESNQVIFDEKNGHFVDLLTNEPITINKAVSLFEGGGERNVNYMRAGIEIGVQLSAAMAIYYKNLVYNQVDFDYGLKDGLKGKLITGKAIRFDDNDKFSNYGHEFAGVMYYQTARSNGFTSLESALIAFASSTAWEFLEYHEVMSINDQIMTPIGGYVIGEATYQISCALLAKNSVVAKTFGYTINPALALNHALDGHFKGDKYAAQPDCKKPRWSDISMYVGLESGKKPYEHKANSDFIVGFDATVINIDNYNREGKTSGMIIDTSLAKMIVEGNGNQGLIDLKVLAQVTMAAYHKKDLAINEKGRLRGYEFTLGLGSASTWYDRGAKELTPNEDFYGTINILGTTAHVNVHHNGFNIRADIGVYGDFAMVKSYSLEKLKEERGDLEGQSSVIKRKGYYYGYGASTIAAISISKDRWTVGYDGQISMATSINSRNRVEGTTGDVFHDRININRVYVSFSFTKNLKFQISKEFVTRSGDVNGSLNKRGTENRIMGTLVYNF